MRRYTGVSSDFMNYLITVKCVPRVEDIARNCGSLFPVKIPAWNNLRKLLPTFLNKSDYQINNNITDICLMSLRCLEIVSKLVLLQHIKL